MKLQHIRVQVLLCMISCFAVYARAMTTQQGTESASSSPIAGATVVDFKGKVQIDLPGQGSSTPSRGQILPAQTLITTRSGRLLLRLEDGSQILVHANTRLLLKQPSSASWQRLELFLGKIKAEIQKRMGGSPPFQIGTPSAVISVRGTRFYVEVNKTKVTRVMVEEGEVLVENARGVGQPVLLKPGFSSQVKEDSAPEVPKATPVGQPEGSGSNNSGAGRDGGAPGLDQRGNPSGSNTPGPAGSRGGSKKP